MGVGDDRLHATQAAPCQLAAPIGVDANGDDDGDRDDAPAAADLQVGSVDPRIRPVALDRPVEEGLDLAVDLLAEP